MATGCTWLKSVQHFVSSAQPSEKDIAASKKKSDVVFTHEQMRTVTFLGKNLSNLPLPVGSLLKASSGEKVIPNGLSLLRLIKPE